MGRVPVDLLTAAGSLPVSSLAKGGCYQPTKKCSAAFPQTLLWRSFDGDTLRQRASNPQALGRSDPVEFWRIGTTGDYVKLNVVAGRNRITLDLIAWDCGQWPDLPRLAGSFLTAGTVFASEFCGSRRAEGHLPCSERRWRSAGRTLRPFRHPDEDRDP